VGLYTKRDLLQENYALIFANIFITLPPFDIILDFEHYQSIVRNYGPILLGLFQTATNLLIEDVSLDQKGQDLDGDISHIRGQLEVLRVEASEAQLGIALVQTGKRLMNDRLNAIRDIIAEKDEELRNKKLLI
jgi:hypothetical protein